MPRVISFIVLLAIVLLVGLVFFQVMAQFLVPLFLACVLLVVFQPLHRWLLRRLPRFPRIAALLTTVLILLAVLLPLVWLGWNAYVELHSLFTGEQRTAAEEKPDEQASTEKNPDESTSLTEQAASGTTDAATSAQNQAIVANLKQRTLELRNQFEHATGIKIDKDKVIGLVDDLITGLPTFAASKAVSGVHFVIRLLIGLAIMIVALYYFLADGPEMIKTVMELTPLDARYEQELLERFGDISRAVVLATLLSAIVQGALAGPGYYFALSSSAPIFLLTALTMVFALVPFVGTAAVWVSVCAGCTCTANGSSTAKSSMAIRRRPSSSRSTARSWSRASTTSSSRSSCTANRSSTRC